MKEDQVGTVESWMQKQKHKKKNGTAVHYVVIQYPR